MNKKNINKHKVVLYLIHVFLYFVFTIGIMVLYFKTESLENVYLPLIIVTISIITSLIINFIKSDKRE